MTTTAPARPISDRPVRHGRGLSVIGLVVALAAISVLIIGGGPPEQKPAVASGRVPVSAAWPQARLNTISDLPLRPMLFLDTATVVGTEPSSDGQFQLLLLRDADGDVRELRRLANADNPRFENIIAAGDDVVWMEFADGRPPEIWAANWRDGASARRLTTETGNAVLLGSQDDLVHHEGRVYWAAQPDGGAGTTEVRSVARKGGLVRVLRVDGDWTMAAWPWLDDGSSRGTAALLLRNLITGREVAVPTSGGELAACSPTWCRVMVVVSDELARIDLMRPDGSARRQIAGATARAAVPDVAILDRFEILAEPGPHAGASRTAALLVHDIAASTTVELDPAANDAQSRNGLVWWYSSGAGAARWHVLDLRTV
ncbi:hypothetical protein AB0F72_34130 [Actinoplanes sp. NPDC023936]|uniref:hypothetical protein n=1 Tax=Actinoplanes sp. NPDC023936 TaxID=3154910 RepID=UPI0033C4D9BB